MNDQLVKKFGPVLATQILPTEVEQRDCPDILFPVILLLRLLLGNSLLLVIIPRIFPELNQLLLRYFIRQLVFREFIKYINVLFDRSAEQLRSF